MPEIFLRRRSWRSLMGEIRFVAMTYWTVLPSLRLDLLADVAHAFALVRLRRIIAADVRRDLADSCLSMPSIVILVFSATVILIPFGNWKMDVDARSRGSDSRMATLDRRLEADALDFEILHETLADAA